MTLVTAKTQKLLFTCVCTRAREASRTHHFTFLNTICSLPFLSHKISISPNLLFHLFPMPSHPFSTFHKTTACFLQNDGLFFIKRRLVFHKTTACFPQNDGSFFLKQRLVFHKTSACFYSKTRHTQLYYKTFRHL